MLLQQSTHCVLWFALTCTVIGCSLQLVGQNLCSLWRGHVFILHLLLGLCILLCEVTLVLPLPLWIPVVECLAECLKSCVGSDMKLWTDQTGRKQKYECHCSHVVVNI